MFLGGEREAKLGRDEVRQGGELGARDRQTDRQMDGWIEQRERGWGPERERGKGERANHLKIHCKRTKQYKTTDKYNTDIIISCS